MFALYSGCAARRRRVVCDFVGNFSAISCQKTVDDVKLSRDVNPQITALLSIRCQKSALNVSLRFLRSSTENRKKDLCLIRLRLNVSL